MVANNDQELRAHRLWKDVADCMQRGSRNPESVARVLQASKDREDFAQTFFPVDKSAESQLKAWQKLYKKHFGLKRDFSKLRIPEKKEGFDRLIVVVREIPTSKISYALQKEMRVWTFTEVKNLDKVQDVVQRPEGDYVIWVRDTQEAHEETANKSAEDIHKEGLNTETLKERLLHELAYFTETGKHMDVDNYTLCSGSRYAYPGGCVSVPGVRWYPDDDGLDVGWGCLDSRRSD